MARVTLNPASGSRRRTFGNLILKRYGDTIILSRKAVFKDRKFTGAQKACQERFREAALFAGKVMADPRARAMYEEEAREKGKPARSLIIADYLRASRVLAETPLNTPASQDAPMRPLLIKGKAPVRAISPGVSGGYRAHKGSKSKHVIRYPPAGLTCPPCLT